jgi:hypothetical protein
MEIGANSERELASQMAAIERAAKEAVAQDKLAALGVPVFFSRLLPLSSLLTYMPISREGSPDCCGYVVFVFRSLEL